MFNKKFGTLLEYRLVIQNCIVMNLYVIQSEKFSPNHYFIVDENNLNEKILSNNHHFKRIKLEEELNTLGIFMCGGDEKFDIIRGKSSDFFVASVRRNF